MPRCQLKKHRTLNPRLLRRATLREMADDEIAVDGVRDET